MATIQEKTTELLQPILNETYELVQVEYVKEGKNWFLRVYVDKPGGITIDECEHISKELSDKLDEEDFIQGNYFLEVSSPGVERPLKSKEDFQASVGKNVYVKLYAHIDGEKDYEGVLKSFNDDIATIEYRVRERKKMVEIPYDKIALARLAVAL